MRVVVPAFLDDFLCGVPDCACRRALAQAASLPSQSRKQSQPPTPAWPPAAAEAALWQGGRACTAGQQGSLSNAQLDAPAADATGPLTAVAVGAEAELYFSALCPQVRDAVSHYRDALDLLRRPDGWRLPLHAIAVDDPSPEVWISAGQPLPWPAWTALRDALLDALADPGLPLLPRIARVALALAQPPAVPATGPVQLAPLTARDYLHVRAHLEARLAAQSPAWLAAHFPAGNGLFPELAEPSAAAWKRALQADWRPALAGPLAECEREVTPALEILLSLQVFAMPMARGLTLQRCLAGWIEALAVGLRWMAALWHWRQAMPDTAQWVAVLAAADAAVAAAAAPLPQLAAPQPTHDRGPRMADLDLSFASLA